MQRFTCTGRLTRDPELRELPERRVRVQAPPRRR